jgi:hypothetical protein
MNESHGGVWQSVTVQGETVLKYPIYYMKETNSEAIPDNKYKAESELTFTVVFLKMTIDVVILDMCVVMMVDTSTTMLLFATLA